MGAGSSVQPSRTATSPAARSLCSTGAPCEVAPSPPGRACRPLHVSGFVLPEDLLRRLLLRLGPSRYLPLAAVCRTWDFISSGLGGSITVRKSSPEHGPLDVSILQGCCIRFRGLRRLCLEDSRSLASHTQQHQGDFVPELFDAMPSLLAACCPLLCHIKFSRCSLSDKQLMSISTTLPELCCLGLDRCPRLTAAGVRELPCLPRLSMLELVCMGRLNNQNVQDIGAIATALQHLDLSSCQGVTARCFEGGFSSVLSLALASCEWLHDRALASIARSCADLVTLNLCHCDALTDEGVVHGVAALRGLQSINLSWCTGVSGTALRALCALPVLQELFLEACCRLTASDVLDLTATNTGAAVLAVLSVARCPRMTDMAVAAVGLRCKAIRQLDVSHCSKLSEAGIVDMMTKSNSLQCIVAKGVNVDLALVRKHVPLARRPRLVL